MLILTRRVGETLMVGDDVTFTVLGVMNRHPRGHRPANHCAGVQVHDHRQIQPAFARIQIGDVARPLLVGLCSI